MRSTFTPSLTQFRALLEEIGSDQATSVDCVVLCVFIFLRQLARDWLDRRSNRIDLRQDSDADTDVTSEQLVS